MMPVIGKRKSRRRFDRSKAPPWAAEAVALDLPATVFAAFAGLPVRRVYSWRSSAYLPASIAQDCSICGVPGAVWCESDAFCPECVHAIGTLVLALRQHPCTRQDWNDGTDFDGAMVAGMLAQQALARLHRRSDERQRHLPFGAGIRAPKGPDQ